MAKTSNSKIASLTAKQQRFVGEYLIDLNATRAAVRSGYSEKTADKQGSHLLGLPHVLKAVEAAKAKRSERTEITQDLVLKELYHLVTSNVENYEVNSGLEKQAISLKAGAPDHAMKAVASVKKKTLLTGGVSVEIRLWDKTTALSLAMRHLGLLNDKLTLDVDEETRKVIENAAAAYDLGMASLAKRIDSGKAAS